MRAERAQCAGSERTDKRGHGMERYAGMALRHRRTVIRLPAVFGIGT
jgi:hypothetical protein